MDMLLKNIFFPVIFICFVVPYLADNLFVYIKIDEVHAIHSEP